MGKGRSYMNSYADGYMRGKVVKEVGALLDNILVEEITTPTIIKLEFGPFSYPDTIEQTITMQIIKIPDSKNQYLHRFYQQRIQRELTQLIARYLKSSS